MYNQCVAAHVLQTYMRRVGCPIHNGLECEQKSRFFVFFFFETVSVKLPNKENS